MSKLGKEPAFSREGVFVPHVGGTHYIGSKGMTKRFYAACAAMQGLLASNAFLIYSTKDQEKCAELSYKFADELLKQEND